jgi:uncharacterized protein YndB with AHSA1/START domain
MDVKQTTDTRPIVVERLLDAPLSLVWKAITDNEAMKQWYFDLPGFKPTVGYEFTFIGKSKTREYIHLCKITEVIPERRLQYSWVYKDEPGSSLVTFELEPAGDQTKLTLTHEGLHTFPANADFARSNFEGGWDSFINKKLVAFLQQ